MTPTSFINPLFRSFPCILGGAVLTVILSTGCGGGGGDASGQSGSAKKQTIANIGSDTMVNLAAAWAENYGAVDKNVSVEVSGGGSGQGIAGLINGTCDIANSSRHIEDKEVAELKAKSGKEAKEFLVGYDALSIFVHKDNPMTEISMEELGEIFREGGKLSNWSDLGIKVPGAKGEEIVRVSRQNNSGTYHYFKEAVVGKKSEFKLGSLDMNGSVDVVQLVGKTPNAIGYSGMGYATPDVKILKVSKKKGETSIMPSVATTLDKSYPIARPMFMYTAGDPAPHAKAYLDWILGDSAQQLVEKMGYVPYKKN